MNVLLEVLLAYLIYRFVAGFLVPIYRTTRNMRRQFQEMNSQRPPADTGGAAQTNTNSQPGNQKTTSSKVGEYIDFEEVK